MTDATVPDPPPTWTIDELAREVGMSVRNLREWRALGLLPAPTMVGRVGHYDAATLGRLRDVQRLHGQGFPLELIARMLAAGGAVVDDVLKLGELLHRPLEDDGGAPDAEAIWGHLPDDVVARGQALGVMVRTPDGTVAYTSERLARVATSMAAMGVPVAATLEATGQVREALDRVAEVLEGVWMDHVWQPWVDAGAPRASRPAIEALLAEMPHRALDTVMAVFSLAMRDRIDAGIAREVRRGAPGG